jgi:hypothetical protein
MLARHSTDSAFPTGTLPQLNRQTLAGAPLLGVSDGHDDKNAVHRFHCLNSLFDLRLQFKESRKPITG